MRRNGVVRIVLVPRYVQIDLLRYHSPTEQHYSSLYDWKRIANRPRVVEVGAILVDAGGHRVGRDA